MSKKHDTPQKKYSYHLYLSGNSIKSDSPISKNGLFVRAIPRKYGIRFVAGPGASQEAGEGNFPHPVIYLGLNRLWPLALLKKLDVKDTPEITAENKKWYIEKYNYILILDEEDNTTEFLKTGIGSKKDFIGASSSDYNSESCSAGQDNLGQILTSILSFRHLKSKLGDKYQGGVLLIDELSATFHAAAQIRLIKALVEVSEELNIQIIATTHSMHLLEEAFHSKLKKNIEVLYLKKSDNNIIDSGFTTFEEIKCSLNVEAIPASKKKTRKVSIFFEDTISKNMFFGIIGNSLNKYLGRVEMKSFDAGSLMKLAVLSEKVPELKNAIFIPDGDVKNELAGHKYLNNILFLPGDSRPETLVYDNLKATKGDGFWCTCNDKYNSYNHQVAITKEGHPPTPSTSEAAKEWYKKWYKNQTKYWGYGHRIVYEKWASDNKDECKDFCQQFFKILKRVSPEQIPESLITNILEKYKLL